jgi:LacI family transcriptional regulator
MPPQKMNKTQSTIYDIARLAGVSPSTVSRALNKPGRISAKTEARIREVAEALGYRLNPLARALPTGRTRTIALILSDITNPVYFDLVRGAERVAASNGYILILAESQESAELETETAQRLMPSVDGLILAAPRLGNSDITELAERKPIVTVNRKVRGVTGVVPDVRPGISAALAHLAALGHTRIVYLAGPKTSWMNRLRERTIVDEARPLGIDVSHVGPTSPTIDGGAGAFESVRSAVGATAVVAYNDLMAIGLLKAARAAGVAVPRDLSVIGFDDIFGADFASPPLTTIRTPLSEIGEKSVTKLIAEVQGDPAEGNGVLATDFVVRESTAARAK